MVALACTGRRMDSAWPTLEASAMWTTVSRYSIETCDLKGASRTVVMSSDRLYLEDFSWLPDGRIDIRAAGSAWLK